MFFSNNPDEPKMLKKCYNNLSIPKSIHTFGFKDDIGLYALYLCAKFHLLGFSYSLTTAIITKVKENFHTAAKLLFCILYKFYLQKRTIIPRFIVVFCFKILSRCP